MLKYQYWAMLASLLTGFVWICIYHLVAASWFFSRLSILLAIISFIPAAIVTLVHGRELGPFLWWDKSNVVLTTRRSPKLEKVELIVMAAFWTVIFGFVVVIIFFFSR
jgi:hypothetical protein